MTQSTAPAMPAGVLKRVAAQTDPALVVHLASHPDPEARGAAAALILVRQLMGDPKTDAEAADALGGALGTLSLAIMIALVSGYGSDAVVLAKAEAFLHAKLARGIATHPNAPAGGTA